MKLTFGAYYDVTPRPGTKHYRSPFIRANYCFSDWYSHADKVGSMRIYVPKPLSENNPPGMDFTDDEVERYAAYLNAMKLGVKFEMDPDYKHSELDKEGKKGEAYAFDVDFTAHSELCSLVLMNVIRNLYERELQPCVKAFFAIADPADAPHVLWNKLIISTYAYRISGHSCRPGGGIYVPTTRLTYSKLRKDKARCSNTQGVLVKYKSDQDFGYYGPEELTALEAALKACKPWKEVERLWQAVLNRMPYKPNDGRGI